MLVAMLVHITQGERKVVRMIDILVLKHKPLGKYELSVGGETYGSGAEFYVDESEGLFDITIDGDELSGEVVTQRFADISNDIRRIRLRRKYSFIKHPHIFNFVTIERTSVDQFKVSVGFGFSAVEWKMPWSFSEYVAESARIVVQQYSPNIVTVEHRTDGSVLNRWFEFPVERASNVIETETSRYRETLQSIHELTEKALTSRLHDASVTMFFNFPNEVKVPCEQYLLYFAQFLHDLGVEAETALTHEAGQVLFTVTPADRDQALDKIRSALDLYLRLASNRVSDATSESIAVQRLEANILRLRGDLKLASAELKAHATTMEAQQLIIDIQKGLLSGEVMVNSIKDVTPKLKNEEKEEFFGGTVSLIPIKGKGVEIHLPEIFRRLRQLFTEK